MNKGLTNYEIFKVVRPIFDEFNLDEFDMPVMHKVELPVTCKCRSGKEE